MTQGLAVQEGKTRAVFAGIALLVSPRSARRACPVATSKSELHDLLAKPALEGIPMLVLGNKNDLSESVSVDALIERLELKALANREVCCYSISAKNAVNSAWLRFLERSAAHVPRTAPSIERSPCSRSVR